MDQSQLSTLDPKLREAYERVMKASAPPATTPGQPVPAPPPEQHTAPTPAAPTPPPSAPSQQATHPAGHDPLDAMAHASTRFTPDLRPAEQKPADPSQPEHASTPPVQPAETHQQQPPPQPAPAATAASVHPSQVNQTVANEQVHAYVAEEVAGVKKSLKFIQAMYIVGGIVFFLVYALFWMKFFNVALPI